MIVFIPLPVIWPGSSISTVRPTTNLSREQSFSKSFSKPEEFKNTFLGIGQKVWGGWIGAERVWVISFGAFGKGWAVQFSATQEGVGFLLFFRNRNWHAFDTIRSNSFQFQKTKRFQAVVEKVQLAGVQWR